MRTFRSTLDAIRAEQFTSPTQHPVRIAELIGAAEDSIRGLLQGINQPRFPVGSHAATVALLPEVGFGLSGDAPNGFAQLVSEFIGGAINWSSPGHYYNVGAATSNIAVASSYIGSRVNVYQINQGLAGAAIHFEGAVAKALARLAGRTNDDTQCLFSFGGTATSLYALKLGLLKALPLSGVEGLPQGRIKVLISEDAHFSQLSNLDWLGLGTSSAYVMRADGMRRSSIVDGRKCLTDALAAGNYVPAIILNGGSTYDHSIDNIADFVELRNELTSAYALSYKPHIHVDSVIGWAWLFFRDYDFVSNPMEFPQEILLALEAQSKLAAVIGLADSWGVDFHKGVGSCAVDCSVFVSNSAVDLARLSRTGRNIPTHQLPTNVHHGNPCDVTLETSRSGTKVLMALATLQYFGVTGFQALLANLVFCTFELRRLLNAAPECGIVVINPASLGYVTMVRLYPNNDGAVSGQSLADEPAELTDKCNEALKEFVAWYYASEDSNSELFSLTSRYIRTSAGRDVAALKFYPTSPFIDVADVHALCIRFLGRLREYNTNIRS
jgi:L-2,4-diaminobutyrate decarboxylase